MFRTFVLSMILVGSVGCANRTQIRTFSNFRKMLPAAQTTDNQTKENLMVYPAPTKEDKAILLDRMSRRESVANVVIVSENDGYQCKSQWICTDDGAWTCSCKAELIGDEL